MCVLVNKKRRVDFERIELTKLLGLTLGSGQIGPQRVQVLVVIRVQELALLHGQDTLGAIVILIGAVSSTG